ncbi:MAG: glycosyltransferase family 4 protein [Bacteroidetes bacterium]|nr:glycosyltransferase family 4 protein [Bacteroidota bacterium]
MEIAVNTRFLLPGRIEGLGRFSHEVLRRMVQQQPDVVFHFFFDRPYDADYLYGPNVVPHVLSPQARHPLLYYLFFEHAVRRKLSRLNPAVFFSPDGYLSLASRLPQVPVFHDLAYMHYPQYVGPAHRWHYRHFFPRYAQKAAHILTVSSYSKADIVQYFRVPESKVTVCHNGAGEVFRPLGEAEREKARAAFAEGKPYFLYVGSIHPRKNLENLLRAFERFKEQTGHPAKLLLTGRKAWDFENVIQFYTQMRHRDDVCFTGYVDDESLNQLLNGALALCYVSLFEGFGLPILEAFWAETAVLCSNTSSMPEVAGDAALLADPTLPEQIAHQMEQLLEADLRQSLIARGQQQRLHFSWDQTARICFHTLQQVAR